MLNRNTEQYITMKTVLKNCLHCKSEFNAPVRELNRGYGKFCSVKCANSHRLGVKKTEANRACDLCGTMFRLMPSRSKLSKSGLSFCCRTCKDVAQRLEHGFTNMHPAHYGTADNSDNHSSTFRVIAFRNKELKCERCGYDKYIQVLEVHHKDRNRRNNTTDNLEILCPTCHMEHHFITKTGRYTTVKQ